MLIDVILEPGADADTVCRVAELAERHGLHGVWTSNFPAQRDPFMTLVAAARATSRVRLGVMPWSPYEKHPVKLADSLLTLHDLSRGRASILVGGMGKSVMRATGLTPVKRVTAVRECVAILRGAIAASCGTATAAFSWRGSMYEAAQYSAPWAAGLPAPLIYIAANGPQMLQLAGEIGDGLMLSDVVEPHFPEVLDHVARGLTTAGRSRESLRLSNFFAWHVKEDRAAAVAEARCELVWRGALLRWHIAPYLAEDDIACVERHWDRFLQAFLTRSPVIHGVPDRIIDALVAGLTFTGTRDAIPGIAARLIALADLGQTEVALRLFREPEAGVRLIGEALQVALRQHSRSNAASVTSGWAVPD